MGHTATTAALKLRGVAGLTLRRLLAGGTVYRVRRGLYACSHLSDDEQLAVRIGGRLDCVSALRAHGIWTGKVRGYHLRLAPDHGRASARSTSARRRVVRHWNLPHTAAANGVYVSVIDALLSAMDCLEPDDLLAAIESAVFLQKISPDQAHDVASRAPRRLRKALREIDPEFRAQSGYETLMRLRLRRAGHRVEPQAYLPGVGHLDNLVDGVLALETDGRQHDSSAAEDRRRDLGTEAWRIRVLRIDPGQIEHDWPGVLGVIEQMIADAHAARSPRGTSPGDTPRG